MGRTLPSAMMVFDGEAGRWSKFRRALRREDQDIFDAIFRGARKHIAAMAYESSPIPLEGIFLAMLVEERKSVTALEARVKKLENRSDALVPSAPSPRRGEGQEEVRPSPGPSPSLVETPSPVPRGREVPGVQKG